MGLGIWKVGVLRLSARVWNFAIEVKRVKHGRQGVGGDSSVHTTSHDEPNVEDQQCERQAPPGPAGHTSPCQEPAGWSAGAASVRKEPGAEHMSWPRRVWLRRRGNDATTQQESLVRRWEDFISLLELAGDVEDQDVAKIEAASKAAKALPKPVLTAIPDIFQKNPIVMLAIKREYDEILAICHVERDGCESCTEKMAVRVMVQAFCLYFAHLSSLECGRPRAGARKVMSFSSISTFLSG